MYTLITAASSAKAYQLKNQLQAPNVLLGDHLDLPEVMIKTGKMIRLPNPQSETYPHEMLALSLDHDIDTIYLLRAEEVKLLVEAEILFNEYGIKIIGHD